MDLDCQSWFFVACQHSKMFHNYHDLHNLTDSCKAGAYMDKSQSVAVCQWCPQGFYQPVGGQFYCEPCPADKTTQFDDSRGATSISQCVGKSQYYVQYIFVYSDSLLIRIQS